MNYAVGSNMPGYLPEGDMFVVATLDEAKQILLDDLERSADAAWEACETTTEGDKVTYEFNQAANDVRSATGPGTFYVDTRPNAEHGQGIIAFWIHESDEPVTDES